MGNKRLIRLASAALFAAALAVTAPLAIPLGALPVSLSVGLIICFSSLLPPAVSLSGVLCYLLLGLVGLPVFAGFAAGPAAFLSPPCGFLFGYLALAAAVSLGSYRRGSLAFVLASSVGLALLYLAGAAGYIAVSRLAPAAAAAAVLPYLPIDLAKLALALALRRFLLRRGKSG